MHHFVAKSAIKITDEFLSVRNYNRFKRKSSRIRMQNLEAEVGYAPMQERKALASDWLKRCTSASCSASTMTRASCSVPE
jgi:hypothetical protein